MTVFQFVGVLMLIVFTIEIFSAYACWLQYQYKVKDLKAQVAMRQEETASIKLFQNIQKYQQRRCAVNISKEIKNEVI